MTTSPIRRQAALDALALDDEALLKACEVDYFIASGPGGQHRNTTASGVRLTHGATELSVTATERRSQTQNKGVALDRLREGLRALTFVPKVRRATRPTAGAKRRRLEGKKRTSEKKTLRGKSDW
ncbi:peptide chain release factor-like protein [Myxococcus sp. CA051A]|uniref:Peptide chain release factor-like protein n=1 Tax=Myxococcus llanfairpwllgwyngyllgogerychwyrndrobwllllantysiliogogogochensis TaxID=2590453 RepID=A0A540X312_9BACT|nr:MULTISPECIES: peptide chain release factor-like protein [Myxococcus]NTX04986.1 peptide chain release factor-like protein [Myxococcus sp. CA040A]NTX15339.1 peptide chain release factor-like protein [Myxococcus sp. CA056]NTX37907.1 peptide chain release factor-like protein [Myxococcus sp. CA033]NTX54064.1 peptide chain release factor-like protein [Myxococcus sp. CA039A]NTX61556.1 peptide chain release factor-like protein [Myxococcus sp. CA051A]